MRGPWFYQGAHGQALSIVLVVGLGVLLAVGLLTARWWLDPLIRRSQRSKPRTAPRYVRKPRLSEIRKHR